MLCFPTPLLKIYILRDFKITLRGGRGTSGWSTSVNRGQAGGRVTVSVNLLTEMDPITGRLCQNINQGICPNVTISVNSPSTEAVVLGPPLMLAMYTKTGVALLTLHVSQQRDI